MASIRLHGKKWQARVIRKGHSAQTRSFVTRQEAVKWAREIEYLLDGEAYQTHSSINSQTLGELITRYLDVVTPNMKSAQHDTIRLNALLRRRIATVKLTELSPSVIANHRDQRLSEVSSGTVVRELAYLSSIINHARKEWGLRITNPVQLVRKPTVPKGRSRILSDDELRSLFEAAKPTGRRNPLLLPIIHFALETAMRRGEILSLSWPDIDMERRLAHLFDTKNGTDRIVPLSSKAVQILEQTPKSHSQIFPLTACALHAMFAKARKRACITDFHFHDLRHMAISMIARKLPNVIELSAVSGHKSLRMLQRYYHPDASDLARKLG